MNIYKDIKSVGEYDKDYIIGLHKCKTLEELRIFLEKWRWIAEDAYQKSQEMDEERFKKFKKDSVKEKAGKI